MQQEVWRGRAQQSKAVGVLSRPGERHPHLAEHDAELGTLWGLAVSPTSTSCSLLPAAPPPESHHLGLPTKPSPKPQCSAGPRHRSPKPPGPQVGLQDTPNPKRGETLRGEPRSRRCHGGGPRLPAAGGPCAPGAPHLLRADPIQAKPTRSDPIRFSPARSSPAEGRRPARPRQRAGLRQREVAELGSLPLSPPLPFCPHQRWAAAEDGEMWPQNPGDERSRWGEGLNGCSSPPRCYPRGILSLSSPRSGAPGRVAGVVPTLGSAPRRGRSKGEAAGGAAGAGGFWTSPSCSQ